MASGRIKKWFKSLPLETRSDSHLARQSDASDIGPVATEATAVARDVTSDVVSPLSHLVGATTKETTLSGPAHHLGSKIADEHIKKIKRFRVLVMGRANAGKTTILHRVCNSTDQPEIFDGKGNKIENDIVQGTLTRGYHDIENELVFRSCPGFIFHDSCGFEAGSTQQFDQMSNFVVRCGATRNLNKRVHVIWFCIPMTDSHRTVTAAEQKFFNACDTGHVPVIVVLTKVDALYLTSIRELLDEGSTIAEAKARAPQKQGELLERLLAHIKYELDRCKFPPKGFVLLQKMNGEDADPTPLMECTTNMLVGGGLQRLLIATQQSQITLSIQHAVYWVVERMMLKIIKQGETPDMKSFECNILHWFPNHAQHFLGDLTEVAIEDRSNMLTQDVTVQSIAEHGVACLLIFEYCYFLLQHEQCPKKEGVIPLAVKEYKSSGVAATIHQSVKRAVQYHGHNVDNLCQTLVTITLENRMSYKLFN